MRAPFRLSVPMKACASTVTWKRLACGGVSKAKCTTPGSKVMLLDALSPPSRLSYRDCMVSNYAMNTHLGSTHTYIYNMDLFDIVAM